MTVDVGVFDDAQAFAAIARPFVDSDPGGTTVLATVLTDVLTGHRSYPGATWLVAHEAGAAVGVGMHTPPHRFWVSPMPDDAAAKMAAEMARLAEPGMVPGIAGEQRAAGIAADTWARERPSESMIQTRSLRLYELVALTSPTKVTGHERQANTADTDLLLRWQRAFAEECNTLLVDRGADTAARLAGHGAYHVWEVEGRVVSMAGHTAEVAATVRVGPVYTPKDLRAHGYGAAVTAATTRHALQSGAEHVVLFTDLANPISNSIYQRIGYRPVRDYVEWDLR
jgi:predicted GNAT family acetyltransferase